MENRAFDAGILVGKEQGGYRQSLPRPRRSRRRSWGLASNQ